jgi:hypothetical protein
VALCGGCPDVHIALGPVVVRVARGDFRRLCALLQTAGLHPALAPRGAEKGLYILEFVDGAPRFKTARGRRKP